MNAEAKKVETKTKTNGSSLSRPGALIAIGLAVQALTLFSIGPIPFLLDVGVGIALVVLGVADYLWQLLRATPQG